MSSISPYISANIALLCTVDYTNTKETYEQTNQPATLRTPVSMTEFEKILRASPAYINFLESSPCPVVRYWRMPIGTNCLGGEEFEPYFVCS